MPHALTQVCKVDTLKELLHHTILTDALFTYQLVAIRVKLFQGEYIAAVLELTNAHEETYFSRKW